MIPADSDTQKFSATVTLTWEAELFPGDPDDMYEVAELEKTALYEGLRASLGSGFEIKIQRVSPVY